MGTTGLTVRIAHPFHPLNGQVFEVISHGPHWGEDRVVYRAADGTLPSIATGLTDMSQIDAFCLVAAGRAAFRTIDLIDLLALLDGLSTSFGADSE